MKEGESYRLDCDRPQSVGKVREFLGNVPQVIKAYGWARAMGAEGIREASDLSVLANNYMESRLVKIRGVSRSHPEQAAWRLEMTRYSLGAVFEETGVSAVDIQNRMADFGIDAMWLSHEPWIVPQPFTPEAGEMWSKEDLDTWIDVLAHVVDEAYESPEIVKTAPHNQAIAQIDASPLDDPARWATTWRVWKRKHGSNGAASNGGFEAPEHGHGAGQAPQPLGG